MRDPKEISHSLTVSAISSKSQCTRLLLKITGITLLSVCFFECVWMEKLKILRNFKF